MLTHQFSLVTDCNLPSQQRRISAMNNKKHILSPEERRMIYIDYLKKNNGASTGEFLTYLKEKYNVTISRGTLCEDREYLKKMNYKFTCQKRKYFLLEEPSGTENFSYNTIQEFTSCINKDLFLDWLLLIEGLEKEPNFDKKSFNNGALQSINERSIQEHLFSLSQKGYLNFKNSQSANRQYNFRSSVPSVYSFSDNDLFTFINNYENVTPATGAVASFIKPFYHFCTLLLNNSFSDINDTDFIADGHFHYGRQNEFSDEINQQLRLLNQLPYEKQQLNLFFSSPKSPEKQHFLFSVGILFYSVEINQCYLLGESEQGKNLLIRLDRIDFNATTASNNPISFDENKKAVLNRIYAEMFSASLDEPEQVIVRFDSFSRNIETKVNALHQYRFSTSTIETVEDENGKGIIYKDTIRGLTSFAHYLRTFSYGAKVIYPQKLKDMMLSSAQQVFNNYSEI